MSETPFLSVLITAYRRKEYLLRAVRSVQAQTLPRSEFEIVVIKAFTDAAIDRELAAADCRVLDDCPESIGGMMSAGFRACRGEVVSVLDDDDEFETEKLRFVRDTFAHWPGLGYLHNGLRLIDEQGAPVGPADPKPGDRAYDMSQDEGFCTSCISVRRTTMERVLDRWPSVTKGEDTFLDHVSRATGAARLVSPTPLTRYRVHPAMSSSTTNFAAAYLATAKVILTLPRSPARDSSLAVLLGRYMSAAVRGRSSDRGGALWALSQLLRSGHLTELKPDAREILCGALIGVSPGLSATTYRALRRGNVDWLPPATTPRPRGP